MWTQAEVEEVVGDGLMIADNYSLTEFPLWRYLLGDRRMRHPRMGLGAVRNVRGGASKSPVGTLALAPEQGF